MGCKGVIVHILSSNRWSGIERYTLDICRSFIDEGWRVAAFTRDARGVDPLFREAGVELHHAPLHGFFDPSSAVSMAKYMKTLPEGSVIFHAHHYRDIFTVLLAKKLARRKDIRVVSTRHSVRRGRDNRLFRRIYRNTDAQIFVSETAQRRFLDTWHGRRLPFPADRMHVIFNSLYIESPEPLPEPERGPVTAMFHGPLIPGKGLEVLIDAMSLLKRTKIRLKIVGTGQPDYVDSLRRRALTREVMDMIDWHKHTKRPLDIIGGCHFGVLPSVKEEAFGLANLEYMASGRPHVTTANGAQKEYLTDGREAFLVPASDAGALSDAMRHLASDRELRMRMGAAALATFRDTLAWPRVLPRIKRAYGL